MFATQQQVLDQVSQSNNQLEQANTRLNDSLQRVTSLCDVALRNMVQNASTQPGTINRAQSGATLVQLSQITSTLRQLNEQRTELQQMNDSNQQSNASTNNIPPPQPTNNQQSSTTSTNINISQPTSTDTSNAGPNVNASQHHSGSSSSITPILNNLVSQVARVVAPTVDDVNQAPERNVVQNGRSLHQTRFGRGLFPGTYTSVRIIICPCYAEKYGAVRNLHHVVGVDSANTGSSKFATDLHQQKANWIKQ